MQQLGLDWGGVELDLVDRYLHGADMVSGDVAQA
jgi:hypothetical protein